MASSLNQTNQNGTHIALAHTQDTTKKEEEKREQIKRMNRNQADDRKRKRQKVAFDIRNIGCNFGDDVGGSDIRLHRRRFRFAQWYCSQQKRQNLLLSRSIFFLVSSLVPFVLSVSRCLPLVFNRFVFQFYIRFFVPMIFYVCAVCVCVCRLAVVSLACRLCSIHHPALTNMRPFRSFLMWCNEMKTTTIRRKCVHEMEIVHPNANILGAHTSAQD